MTEDKTTITKPEWISTYTYTDEEICSFADDELSYPFYEAGPNTPEAEIQELYTKRQMLEMFRIGSKITAERIYYRKKPGKRNSVHPRPYPLMRFMKKGDSILLPFEKWQAARTAACKLRKQFGSVFAVRKMIIGEPSDIEVTRLQ